MSRGRVARAGLVALDALVYALTLTLVSTVGATVLAIVAGGNVTQVKVFLFVIGWALISYGTFRLWPRSPDESQSGRSIPADPADRSIPADPADRSRFQRLVERLSPLRWTGVELDRTRRVGPPAKLFLGGIIVLLTSFLMEVAGNVG